MRDQGLKAKFILSSDDIDPFDKPIKGMPEYDKYLGMPFRNMPSPVKGYESFAEYYFMQSVEKFEELGIEADIESTGEQYEKGAFNPVIKTALDNAEKIRDIYKRLYGEKAARRKYQFNIICEKCGKIATTEITNWDPEKELVTYECRDDVVAWAKGCGHKSTISPYNGNGKFPWKVEWAAKWPTRHVVCELAGKDHFTKGGSRDCAVAISNEVFDFPPPYPSTRKARGKAYEFFNIGGKKMSTSMGRGIPFADITKYVPPKILRYLLIKTRPHAVVDFDPFADNDIIFLFDRYDKTERIYFEADKLENEKEKETHKRIYQLSHVGELPAKMPVQIPFSFASTVIQVGMDEEGALGILKKMGHVPEEISGIDLHYVLERLHDAKGWIEGFASENYKFQLQEQVAKKLKIGKKEKEALNLVAKKLKEQTWTDKELHDEFYAISEKLGLEPKDFFKAAYQVLINKEKGPRLASFVLAAGEKAVELFEQV
jgi:lysyl-tRNA synthetase class 1